MAYQLGIPFSIIEFLLSRNSRINFNDFAYLASNVEPTLVEPVYDYVDLDKRDHSGMSAFHLAVRSNHVDGVRRLLRRGADVNEKTANLLASTPLHLASEFASLQCMELLLQHGADPIAVDALNNSALTRIVTHRRFSLSDVPSQSTTKIELLLEYGADLDDVLLENWLFEASEESLRIMTQRLALRDEEHANKVCHVLPFGDPELDSFYAKCREEASLMRKFTIFRDLTVYQLMRGNSRHLLRYFKNNAFKSCLRSKKLTTAFPNYHEMITKRYRILYKQKKIFTEASKSLELILGSLYGNHLITERIIARLGTQDMWNLIYAVDSVKRA